MPDSFQALMREATRLTRSGRLTEATQVIQRAMGRAGPPAAEADLSGGALQNDPNVLEGLVREIHADIENPNERAPVSEAPFEPPTAHPSAPRTAAPTAQPTAQPTEHSPADRQPVESFTGGAFTEGEFKEGEFTRGAQRHRYKLFTPPHHESDSPLPLVVMLHGCTQNPDDFALGTGMNEAAFGGDGGGDRAQGFYVLYPSQPSSANAQGCWNWFDRAHQQRGQGEPAWIAELTLHLLATRRIDPQRVYIAGLSAGGAMAAVVAAAYPDVFAAVGVHSGLPVGAASNLTQALSAMKRGPSVPVHPSTAVLPTIVFHGDQDRTVHVANAQALIAAAAANATGSVKTEAGASAFGKKFTRSVYANSSGVQAEQWQLHGAGHAWAGGAAKGSYTDPRGVNATAEMLRFFWQHRLAQA